MIRRMRPSQALMVPALLLCATGPAAADLVDLPVRRPISLDSINVDLRGGRVSVIVDPGRESTISVRDRQEGEETVGFVRLSEERGTLMVRQPQGPEDLAPPLIVEIVIRPDQKLAVRGLNVDVSISGVEIPPEPGGEGGSGAPQDSQPAAGTPRNRVVARNKEAPLVLELDRGSVFLERVAGIYLTATSSNVDLVDTRGEADLALRDGGARIRGHRGTLLLTGDNAELRADASQGPISAYVVSSVLAISGDGVLRIDGEDSDIIVQQWIGPATVLGNLQRVEVIDSGTAEGTIVARGEQLQLLVSGYAGGIVAEPIGGRVDLREVAGRVKVMASDAAVLRIEEVQDFTDLQLKDGVTAEVFEIGRMLRVRLEDGRLDVSQAQQLDLVADESFVRVDGIFGNTKVRLKDAEAELDLSENRSSPSVTAQGFSRATITMTQPCSVRIDRASPDAPADDAEVSGCQLIDSDRRRPVIRSSAGRPPIVLALKLEGDATAEVRGTP